MSVELKSRVLAERLGPSLAVCMNGHKTESGSDRDDF